MARKSTHFSYTHLTTVYNIIIHVSLVITLIFFFSSFFFFLFVVNFVIHWNEKALGSHVFCSVQSMSSSPWQNSNHQWSLWWVFLMNIYCSWVAQLFLYMIPRQKKKKKNVIPWTSQCVMFVQKLLKEMMKGEISSSNSAWFEI